MKYNLLLNLNIIKLNHVLRTKLKFKFQNYNY